MRDKAWRRQQESDHTYKKKFSKRGKPKGEDIRPGKVKEDELEELLSEEAPLRMAGGEAWTEENCIADLLNIPESDR